MTDPTIGEFPDEGKENQDESPLDIYFYERRHELKPGSKRAVRTSWHRLEDWLEEKDYELFDVGFDRAVDFADWLDSRVDRQAEDYMRNIANVIGRLSAEGYIAGSNPFEKANRVYEFTPADSRPKPEVPYEKITTGVREIRRPAIFTSVSLMLKTGIRIGSVVNQDDRDIHLDHPVSAVMDDPRPAIENKPNSIYVDSSVNEGEVFNGELRKTGVKDSSTRAIPIDDELVEILGWYRSLRLESQSDANPFFASMGNNSNEFNGIASRPSKQYIRMGMNEWCNQYSWGEDLHPHWCRHWWTTQMRANVDSEEVPIGSVKDFVKGLRGDTDEDVIDTYTHEWYEGLEADDVQPYTEVVRKNMPKLL